jgi:mannosyltransferase OCH1-like enzyme
VKADSTKVVHQIWLQGGDPPEALFTCVQSVRKTCEKFGWGYTLWSAASIAQLPGKEGQLFQELSPKCTEISAQSNVGRFVILASLGGLYLDTDVQLWGLPSVLEGAWIPETPAIHRFSSFALMCPPHHSWIGRVLGRLSDLDLGKSYTAGEQFVAKSFGPDVNCWPFWFWRSKYQKRGAIGEHGWLGSRLGHFKLPPVVIE